MSSNIITAADALARLSDGSRTVFLDVRSLPGAPSLRPEYEVQHISGAHFVELSEQLQSPKDGFSGNRPLPTIDALQAEVERWGIDDDTHVVVYSAGTHGAAARAWFVLRWAGLTDVRYLDGGLSAWIDAGGPTDGEPATEGGGTARLRATGASTGAEAPTATGGPTAIGADDIQRLLDGGEVVVDARKASKFSGDELDDEGNRGHIPGAISVPGGSLLRREDGRIRDAAELHARFDALGISPERPVGVYCGGGVSAALATLVLTELGYRPELFVGSFSAWASDPARPVTVPKTTVPETSSPV